MSNLVVSNISDGTTSVGTGYVVNGSAKAWVNFNGTGTVAIRDSLNIGSLTDNGTGSWNINFTNNMANTNYAATSAIAQFSPFPIAQAYIQSTQVNYQNLNVAQPGTSDYDAAKILAHVQGDLA